MFHCTIKMAIIPSTTGRNDFFWNVFLPVFDPCGIRGSDSSLAEYSTNYFGSNCSVPLGAQSGLKNTNYP
jgi:hypothetical protein